MQIGIGCIDNLLVTMVLTKKIMEKHVPKNNFHFIFTWEFGKQSLI
jgi:hypothetical protein